MTRQQQATWTRHDGHPCIAGIIVGCMLLLGSMLGSTTTFGQTTPAATGESVQLAPAIGEAPHSDAVRGSYYTNTVTVDLTPRPVWLAGTPDGQGDLCTDDQASVTFFQGGQPVAQWEHAFASAPQQGLTCLPAQALTDLVPSGTYTVTIELIDQFPDTYGSTPYYLVLTDPSGATGTAPTATAQPTATTQPTTTAQPTGAPTATPPQAAPIDAATTDPPAATDPLAGLVDPAWLLPGLLGGGALLATLGVGLLLRRPAAHPDGPAIGGTVSLFDQETRQAQTVVLQGQAWRLYRAPLRLMPAETADAETAEPLAQVAISSEGLVVQDDADLREHVLTPGNTVAVADGRVTLHYQG